MSFEHGRGTKEFQDFFTPKEIAEQLARFAAEDIARLYKALGRPVVIVEPACGTGNLIWPLLKLDTPIEIHCLDIQEDYLEWLEWWALNMGYSVERTEFGLIVKNTQTD